MEGNFVLLNIDFLGDFGFANGGKGGTSDGILLRSTDGGLNWETLYFPGSGLGCCTPGNLQILNDTTVILGSVAEGIFISTNRGNDWDYIQRPEEWGTNFSGILDIEFSSINKGWVVLANSGVHATFDGGETWTYPILDSSIRDITFINDSTGVAVGQNIWKTEDGGANWTRVLYYQEEIHMNKVQFVNDSVGFAMQLSSLVLHTTDGGDNWEFIAAESPELIYVSDMHFLNDSVGYIASSSYDQILVTKDGGHSWHSTGEIPSNYSSQLGQYISAIYMTDEQHGFATTYGGYILKYSNEVPTSCDVHITLENPESLLHKITWEVDADFEGCLDGFEVRILSSEYSDTIDVGLTYSYQLTEPVLPPASTVIYDVVPYNTILGGQSTCGGLGTWTIPCPALPVPIDTFICQGEDFVWDGHVFSETGVFEIPYLAENGCDSTITLNLQWYQPPEQTIIDTAIISGTSFNGVSYEQDTIFSALYPSADGCDSIVTYIINVITDTKEPDEGLFWQIYPNPITDGDLYLMGKKAWQQAALYDAKGWKVQKWEGNYPAGRNKLELNQIPSGVYYLMIQGSGNVWTKRIVKL